MVSVNTTVLDRPKTQDYILTNVLRCDFLIQPHYICIVTSDSYGVTSFLFMRINYVKIIFNIR
jgi:hypothetical protein